MAEHQHEGGCCCDHAQTAQETEETLSHAHSHSGEPAHDHGKHDHCDCEHLEHCGCGHDHDHPEGCSCGHDHSHHHSEGCACGLDHDISLESCDDGCGHDHDHAEGKSAWIAIIAAAVLAVLSFLPMPDLASHLMLAAAAVIAGFPLFWAGVQSIFHLRLDETALLLIAVVAAMALGEFWEGALVTILFRLGNQLEGLAIARSKKSIAALTKIRPETANLLQENGSYAEVAAGSIPTGSRILVKPGDRVPLDAVVESGESMVDTAVLTGESLPRQVGAGDELLSGMVNRDGALHCRTTNTFSDSAASRIIQLVQESSAKKGNTEKLISKFSKIYTPCIIISAILLTVVPPLLGLGPISMWLSRALVFLVASCPCALVISIPLSFFAGIGAGSRRGVLVKGSKSLEALAKTRNAVFDKTGTLTTGKLSVTSIVPLGNSLSADELLRLCAIGESFSAHPMAQAVVVRHGPVDSSIVTEYQELPGMGVTYRIGADEYLCGGERLLNKYGLDVSALPHANIYLVKNGVPLGYLTVADTLRPDAKAALAQLKAQGIERTVILTGDNARTAETIRQESGADQVWAELLPADKVTHLEQIKQTGSTLFVGDGMNDAPVLAMADVGVAMGLGTDAAIEAADVVLVSDKLSDLPEAVKLARRTLSIAKFNIVFALGIKAIVLVLGACGLAAMWMAVFADVGVSILAVLNATRILGGKRK
ncbi:MAG: heavy metal translocating P-type ATPase [Oscillospiraceae bacterium]|nr:heavy metal translocating P-type ATPase [Oscillospiraceae bacterium]